MPTHPSANVPYSQAKIAAGSITLAPRSVLVLDGAGITIKNLRVEGALVVRAVPGAKVVVDGLSISNAGWEWAAGEQVRFVCCYRKEML